MANRTITDDDRVAAVNLRRIWEREKAFRSFTQETAADELGWTQGMISQYLNLHTALGVEATLKLARFLRCNPLEIRPDLEHLVADESMTQSDVEFAALLSRIPEGPPKESLLQLIRHLAGNE
jgi:hypothetical protein